MRSRPSSSGLAGVAVTITAAALAGASLVAQTKASWTPPLTPEGRPDLEGAWENNSATPLERPAQLAQKPRLTDEELETLKRRAAVLFNAEADAVFGDSLYLNLLADRRYSGLGATGTYSQNWLPDRYFEHRTSLIVDPADGRLPPMTAEATAARAAAAAARQRLPTKAQDLTLTDRCIAYGVPDLFAAYMSVYRIVQAPQYVAIVMEKIHDARVIWLDGRPHPSPAIRSYMGDARGRWERDSLVVDTTNFHPNGNPMGGLLARASQNLHLTERFRRTNPTTLEYTFTVDDPSVWTKPWTAVINWQQAKGDVIEYACHEGNYSLPGMLTGARADERRAR
ncbi:MAG TPA: hypothetical protein VFV95_00260 [Vicinamibacterales bacterium]|nr:hypothetical protein [Vicinamibacterales bacterium]